MYINDLSFINFRNLADTVLELSPGINIFYGDNAQGKTNLLEAAYMCSTGRSIRTKTETQLIRFGKDLAHIRTYAFLETIAKRVDVHLEGGKKRLAVNGFPVKKMSEFFGSISAVMFSPEDLRLIKGGPSERRRFMDMEICQMSRVYCADLQNYHKALKQRNMLLKSKEKNGSAFDLLDVWDGQLVSYGRRIIRTREKFCLKLNDKAGRLHSGITGFGEELEIKYVPSCAIDDLEEKLRESRARDLVLGTTSKGPHRDDLSFIINGRDARDFGSQGQQRTACLSAKIAEIELIAEETGESPILLLDDVLSELDEKRQGFLLENTGNVQTIVTCTGVEDSLGRFLKDCTMYNVKNGEFIRIS